MVKQIWKALNQRGLDSSLVQDFSESLLAVTPGSGKDPL